MGNHWGIHRDPEYYPDPETFNIERWLIKDDTGGYKLNKEMKHFQFGFGRRLVTALRPVSAERLTFSPESALASILPTGLFSSTRRTSYGLSISPRRRTSLSTPLRSPTLRIAIRYHTKPGSVPDSTESERCWPSSRYVSKGLCHVN